jgi:hypothetical protein
VIFAALRCSFNSLIGTSLETLTTADTFVLEEHYLPLDPHGFRVVTPEAPQRTTLEEHCCPYPRPIMHCEALYIKYNTAWIAHLPILVPK